MAHKENIEKHINTHTHTHKYIDCAHVLCLCVCVCVLNFYHLLCLPIFPFGKKIMNFSCVSILSFSLSLSVAELAAGRWRIRNGSALPLFVLFI